MQAIWFQALATKKCFLDRTCSMAWRSHSPFLENRALFLQHKPLIGHLDTLFACSLRDPPQFSSGFSSKSEAPYNHCCLSLELKYAPFAVGSHFVSLDFLRVHRDKDELHRFKAELAIGHFSENHLSTQSPFLESPCSSVFLPVPNLSFYRGLRKLFLRLKMRS